MAPAALPAAGGRGRLLLRAAAAVALIGIVVAIVGPARIGATLRTVELGWFAAAVLVAAAAQLTSALRWAGIARALDLAAPTALFITSYAQGITLNVLLPGATLGGDTLRSLRLGRHGHPLAVAALSVLLDRLSGLWMLCAMSLVATLVLIGSGRLSATDWSAVSGPLAGIVGAQDTPIGGLWPWLYLGGLALAVAVPFAPWRSPGGADPIAAIAPEDARPAPVRPRLRARIAQLHALVLTRRRPLARSLWPSLLVQLLSATSLWLCLRATGHAGALAAVLMAIAPIFIAAALPISIGGFGLREMAALVMFPLVGIGAEQGVAAAALYGLTAVVLGIAAAPLFLMQPLRTDAAVSARD